MTRNKKIQQSVKQQFDLGQDYAARKLYKEAFEIFNKLYESGVDEVSFELGMMYLNGYYVDRDFKKALFYFENKTSENEGVSEFNAALILISGDLGEINPEKAIEYYKKSIEKGYASSAHNLALIYSRGEFVDLNMDLAFEYLEKAKDLGHWNSPSILAHYYHRGVFVEKNLNKAIENYTVAVDRGNLLAAFNLGILYYYDLEERNFDKAEKHFHEVENNENYQNPEEHIDYVKLKLSQFYAKEFQVFGIEKAKSIINKLIDKESLQAINYSTHEFIRNIESDECSFEVKENIYKLLQDLNLTVSLIKEKHIFYDGVLSHFTTWKAIENILPLDDVKKTNGKVINESNVLRYYHVDYMNDPHEGETLKKFSSDKSSLNEIFDDFYHRSFDGEICDFLPSVFSLSFTSASDRLDLWRAYGNDGDGFSISFPVIRYSDENSLQSTLDTFNQINREDMPNENNDVIEELESKIPTLYEIHYDQNSIENTLSALEPSLKIIKDYISNELNGNVNLINEVKLKIVSILLDLMFLYKDEQYASEKEVRSLRVEFLKNAMIDERSPGRLFCLTKGFLFIDNYTKLVIGPKVKDSNVALWNLRYRIEKNGFSKTTIVEKSKVKYR